MNSESFRDKNYRYWFRPKRFWGWFAAYYPVSLAGWAVTIIGLLFAAGIFYNADRNSHSASDTLIGSAPGIIIVLLIFDIITLRMGEFPDWWRKRGD